MGLFPIESFLKAGILLRAVFVAAAYGLATALTFGFSLLFAGFGIATAYAHNSIFMAATPPWQFASLMMLTALMGIVIAWRFRRFDARVNQMLRSS